eukprot:scaffold1687_cov405-Prasinococcus_capsulatus_cf.AAC.32
MYPRRPATPSLSPFHAPSAAAQREPRGPARGAIAAGAGLACGAVGFVGCPRRCRRSKAPNPPDTPCCAASAQPAQREGRGGAHERVSLFAKSKCARSQYGRTLVTRWHASSSGPARGETGGGLQPGPEGANVPVAGCAGCTDIHTEARSIDTHFALP